MGADNPEDYGDYFAWGETSQKSINYNWQNYKLANGSNSTLTKYNTQENWGSVDNKTTLEPVDDAATANWHGAWRMPTYEERNALVDSCYWEWTTSYNGKAVNGYIVYKAKANEDMGVKNYDGSVTTVKTYSLSDNHIFLPTAGYRRGAYLNEVGSGYYWSSSLGENYPSFAWYVSFKLGEINKSYTNRSNGFSVRPVLP